MSESVTFRGCFIRSFEFKNGDGERHVRIQMTADWSGPVREAMHWGESAEGRGAEDLVGKLAASHIILTPAKDLKQHELQITADIVGDFNLVPLKDGEGEVTGRELRFTIRTTDEDACAKLESYCNQIGRHLAQLKVSYVKQDELELKDDQGQAVLVGDAAREHAARRGANAN